MTAVSVFFKQKTAYELRIIDWGSDVCSSALVGAAAVSGASAALVSRLVDVPLPQVVVADTERALAAIATAMQQARRTRVAAVTGSNGKTSVKALLLPILQQAAGTGVAYANPGNRNNRSEEHTSELQSLMRISYAVFCLKKK